MRNTGLALNPPQTPPYPKVATRVRLITDLWFAMLMSITQPLMAYDKGGPAIIQAVM